MEPNKMGTEMTVPRIGRRRWTSGQRVPRARSKQIDNLARAFLLTRDDDDLAELWKTVEPYAGRIATLGCWSHRSWLGNRLEPGDLLSEAKILLLERLLRRWNPARGHFIVYALVTFRIEFWKLIRGKGRLYGKQVALETLGEPIVERHCIPRSDQFELHLEIELALRRLAEHKPIAAEIARLYMQGHVASLREAAYIYRSQPGLSKSSLHRYFRKICKDYMPQ